MKLIFCVDKKKGMMFFGKRQSQDSVLRKWMIDYVQGNRLYMSSYSAKQFSTLEGFIVDDDYLKKASTDDYCFVEDGEYTLKNISEIILCNWNRNYPADRFFDIDLKTNGFKKKDSINIVGSSHEKITIDIYKKG